MDNPFLYLNEALARIETKLGHVDWLLSKQHEQQTPDSDTLLTIDQAATFLNLAKQTVYALVARNEIPYSKPGKRLYFSKAELTEWIKAGRNQTIAETTANADKFLAQKGRK